MSIPETFINIARLAFGSAGRDTSYLNRFRNLDGSPYGSTKLARIILTPSFQLNAAIITLGSGLGMRPLHGPAIWATDMLWAAGVCAVNSYAMQRGQRNKLVVDTKGELTDSKATRNAIIRKTVSQFANNGCSIAALILRVQPLGLITGAQSVSDIVIRYKIKSRAWTVTTEPPPPRVPEPKAIKTKAHVYQHA